MARVPVLRPPFCELFSLTYYEQSTVHSDGATQVMHTLAAWPTITHSLFDKAVGSRAQICLKSNLLHVTKRSMQFKSYETVWQGRNAGPRDVQSAMGRV